MSRKMSHKNGIAPRSLRTAQTKQSLDPATHVWKSLNSKLTQEMRTHTRTHVQARACMRTHARMDACIQDPMPPHGARAHRQDGALRQRLAIDESDLHGFKCDSHDRLGCRFACGDSTPGRWLRHGQDGGGLSKMALWCGPHRRRCHRARAVSHQQATRNRVNARSILGPSRVGPSPIRPAPRFVFVFFIKFLPSATHAPKWKPRQGPATRARG